MAVSNSTAYDLAGNSNTASTEFSVYIYNYHGIEATAASEIYPLGSIRSFRDSLLTSDPAGDALTGIYYSRQANQALMTALNSSPLTLQLHSVIYPPIIFFLRMSLMEKALALTTLVGGMLMLARLLERRRCRGKN